VAAADSLKTARDNLAAVILAKTEEWVANGCPPTMSIDGESYDWNGWLQARNAELKGLTENIRLVGGSFIVRTTGRAGR
jgi:hypothetical protein